MESNRLNIAIEGNIPFIKGCLEPYAEVYYLAPGEFTPDAVKDMDALVVRTRTHCDAGLLDGSRVKFVATATIGTDHIDQPWCEAHGVSVANAPGCNAPAVAQYVLASVARLSERPLSDLCIGIVGVGHVGSIVERWARQLGMKVMLNDPPRQAAEGGDQWSSLQEIAEHCDIITFHTPLDDTTRHLADRDFLNSLQRKPILVNAARGGIVDDEALVEALDKDVVSHAVIDCWENEPQILPELLKRVDVATPHIAGYSYEGKVRATRMALDALCSHFALPHIEMTQHVPAGAFDDVTVEDIMASYDPMVDTNRLKNSPAEFESLRNHYDLRHEVGIK